MVRDEQQLFAACQAAYARGRLRWVLWGLLPVLPMTLLAAQHAAVPAVGLGLGALLAGTLALLLWRGGEGAAGAQVGLLAGAMALAIPPLYQVCRHVCIGALCLSTCTLLCALVGVAAGRVLGAGAWWPGASLERRLSALLIAALGGAMGCLEIGASGLAAGLLALLVSGTMAATRSFPSSSSTP